MCSSDLVQVLVVGAPVSEPVNQPRIGVEREDHRFVPGKKRVEILISLSVRVFVFRLQLHQIHDVDDTNF